MFTHTDPNDILLTLYGIIIFTTIGIFWHRRRFLKLALQFPGPLELPFLGVCHRMLDPKEVLQKLSVVLHNLEAKTVFSYFGPQPTLYTIDTEILKKVLTSSELINKADILYSPLSNLFGDGLFTNKSPKWNEHRKLINPSFRLPVLRTFFPILNRNSRHFCRKLEKLVGTGAHNLSHKLEQLTLTTSVENILGKKMENDSEVDEHILHHYSSVMKATLVMVLLSAIKLSGLAKLLNFYKSRQAVFDFVNDIILQNLAKTSSEGKINTDNDYAKNFSDNNNNNNKNNSINDDNDLYFKGKKSIFINEVLKTYHRKQFDWQDITDESNSIIFAAYETTAMTVFTSLTFLAMHPNVQDKLFEEIVNIYPDKDSVDVEYEQLEDCVYLDMVLNETLRIAPAVPTIARSVNEDYQLTPDIRLPKGLIILIGIFELHRNKEIWGPNAKEFNPDNFLPANVAQRHAFSYMPFSKGIRNCIGYRYAAMAVKVILLHLLRNYRFTTTAKFENLEFLNNITLKFAQEPLLEVHKREK